MPANAKSIIPTIQLKSNEYMNIYMNEWFVKYSLLLQGIESQVDVSKNFLWCTIRMNGMNDSSRNVNDCTANVQKAVVCTVKILYKVKNRKNVWKYK